MSDLITALTYTESEDYNMIDADKPVPLTLLCLTGLRGEPVYVVLEKIWSLEPESRAVGRYANEIGTRIFSEAGHSVMVSENPSQVAQKIKELKVRNNDPTRTIRG